MLVIKLEQKFIDAAERWAKQRVLLDRNKKGAFNGKFKGDFHTWFDGYRGELAFSKLMLSYNKKFIYKLNPLTGAEYEDFVVWNQALRLVFDIKASSHPEAKRLMTYEESFKHHQSDYYIGTKIVSDGEVQIWGGCRASDLLLNEDGFDKRKLPTRWQWLEGEQTIRIEEVLNWLDEGEGEVLKDGKPKIIQNL